MQARPDALGRRLPVILVRTAALPLVVSLALARGYPREVVRDYLRQSWRARIGTMWSLMSDPEAAGALVPLRELDAEVLLLNAAADRWAGPRDLSRWQSLLPGAVSVGVSGGHQLLLRDGFGRLGDWVRSAATGYPSGQ